MKAYAQHFFMPDFGARIFHWVAAFFSPSCHKCHLYRKVTAIPILDPLISALSYFIAPLNRSQIELGFCYCGSMLKVMSYRESFIQLCLKVCGLFQQFLHKYIIFFLHKS